MPLRSHVRVLFVPVLALALLLSMLGAPGSAAARDFDDTDDTGQVAEAIEALENEDIVEGCTPDRFCPDEPVSRAETATMLVRALDLPASDRDHFADDGGSVHAENIDALADAGITKGCDQDAFCPQQPTDRDQMAALLARAFELSDADQTYFADVTGEHRAAVAGIAAAGITDGCGTELTAFCPHRNVRRGNMAVFTARALELVDTVEPTTLEQREAEQRRVEQREQEAREAERRAQREAEQRAARIEQENQVWDDLAECESGGNWSINTGNGYYGGLQFHIDTWRSVGGSGYPHQHSREEQIKRGKILQERAGWGQWPHCSRQLGLR